MKHGADWYKREPLAYLGGVQGMRAAHHAVYGVVLELIYAHGGSVNNDPKWIAGWIADMGSAAVRKTIAELVDLGKLTIEADGSLSQKRAKNEVKTRENLRETARENGKKGGENSAKSRATVKENKPVAEAGASRETQADKIREEKRLEADASNTKAPSALSILSPAIGDDLAKAFVAHRKALKAPMTAHAANLLVRKLSGMSDPIAAVERAIEHGWKGVFEQPGQPIPLRNSQFGDDPHGQRPQSRGDRRFAARMAGADAF